MAILIEDTELQSVLSNPLSLYEAVTSWRHYTPKQAVVPGDSELIVTDMVARGCAVACTLVHPRREAFLILLNADDARALGERLSTVGSEIGAAILTELASALGGRR